MDKTPGVPPFSPGPDRSDSSNASANSLRDALRLLAANGMTGASASALSPAELAALAQRAGLSLSGLGDLGLKGPDLPGARSDQAVGPQYVAFPLGDLECALPTDAIQSVQRLPDVTPIPNTAPWLLGVVQLGGNVVSVVDLHSFLDLPPAPPAAHARLLVVSRRGLTIAFVVDTILETRTEAQMPGPSRTGGTPPSWIAPYAAGMVELGGRQLVLLDAEALLFAEKMNRYRAGVA